MPAAPLRLVTLGLVLAGLRGQLVERRAVEAARVDGNARFGAASEQSIDGLLRGLAEQIPERDVDGADRGHADALAAERHRLPVHVLPQELDVPRVGADQQRLQVQVDHLLGDPRRERGVADADETVVGPDLDHQPAVKRERAHRGFR
jgi:hypothetical protein